MLPYTQIAPHVEEKQLVNQTLTTAAGATIVITDVPTIHGTRIDVALGCTGNDIDVELLTYGASKQITLAITLGTVVAGNSTGFTHTAFVGQTCSIRLTNNDGQGGATDATYDLWIGVRS